MKDLLKQYEPYRKDLDFIDQFCDAENSAAGSKVDPNSNVSGHNIATLAPEVHKQANVFANRLRMHDTITEMYGKELADEYLRQLENHEIYRHDEAGMPVGTPYCVSITMYPFLTGGTKILRDNSETPHNLDSFIGSVINLTFAAAGQFMGAIALPELIPYMSWFCMKEWGEDYDLHADDPVYHTITKDRTIRDFIHQKFQQLTYSLNSPSGNRNGQSVFWNISYYDKNYFDSLFETFWFPDGTKMTDTWRQVNFLQREYIMWLNKERDKAILTFPVESFSLLNDGEKYVDQDSADFVAKMHSLGHSMFVYTSKSVDSLASCCFSGDTKVLAKSSEGVYLMPIKELYEMPSSMKSNFTVFHNGSWAQAKIITLPARKMYQIETANNKIFKATDNHLWPTLRGDVRTDYLCPDDYIMFNTMSLDSMPERDLKLTYEQGILVGMYLGDGSTETRDDKYFTVHYSINERKYISMISSMNKGLADCGIDADFTLGKPQNNAFPVYLYGEDLVAFIRQYVSGGHANEKHLNPAVFLQSTEFRRGILDGYYATDGGNSNRIYTTSKQLSEDIEALCTTLGLNTVINVSDRTDEPVVIRGEVFNRNYPLYCVRWYSPKNKRSMGDVFKIVNNSIYFRVKNVEEIEYDDERVYCFERKNQEEPYFTLPSGAITHNCRLRNAIDSEENTFSYTLGAGGIATGSKCVMTVNINRLVQNVMRKKYGFESGHVDEVRDPAKLDENLDAICAEVRSTVKKVHKYLLAFEEIFQKMLSKKMLTVYEAKLIEPYKQYLTTGVNGVCTGAQYLGLTIDDNPSYKKYIQRVLGTISDVDKEDRDPSHGIKFNCEMVPAENLGPKFAKWDAEDKYETFGDCYNSYVYLPEDDTISVQTKFRLHGSEYTGYCDGGSALHVNLKDHLSYEQYKWLMNYAIKCDTNYFTYNVPMTECKDCGHISKHFLQKCPKCGGDNLDYATRVIGYLTRVSKWSPERQAEFKRRYFAEDIKE